MPRSPRRWNQRLAFGCQIASTSSQRAWFSLRRRRAIRVRVADAADLPAAKVICNKYEAGHFDGMTDCYDYDPSAWGAVFGDVRYVFEGVDR